MTPRGVRRSGARARPISLVNRSFYAWLKGVAERWRARETVIAIATSGRLNARATWTYERKDVHAPRIGTPLNFRNIKHARGFRRIEGVRRAPATHLPRPGGGRPDRGYGDGQSRRGGGDGVDILGS